jgi:ketosteroid isomerase-like protein
VKGVRDAFVEFFADDSMGFYPTPMNAREFYRKQPPTPLTQRLEWEPRLGDVARSGDLGWLTGPFTASNTATDAPPRHGCYFSIWGKQRDGTWKVLMDVGVPTPGPVTFAHEGFTAVDEPGLRYLARPGDPVEQGMPVAKMDRALSHWLTREGAAYAYNQILTPVSRLHIPGQQPIVGQAAIRAWLRESQQTLETTPERGGIARSRELAYSWGSYEETRRGPAEPQVQKGHYVRMWKRNGAGEWTLAVEVRSPLPLEKPAH